MKSKQLVCVIVNVMTEEVSPVFVQSNREVAVRSFSKFISDHKSEVGFVPSEHQLHVIAEYDDDQLVPTVMPVTADYLATGADYE